MTMTLRQIEELAADFETSLDIMERFVRRFCPALVLAGQFAQTSDTMLFVHIPKTAGVSVGKAFQKSFDRFHTVQWDNIGPSFRHCTRVATYEQTHRAGRQVIMGHFGWSEIQMWRNHEMPTKCGTIFRNPISRAVSNFNYNSSSAHPGRQAFTEKFPKLETYVKSMALDFQITQAIGLVSSFDHVLLKLTQYYTFLGITEDLAQSLSHLSASHGIPHLSVHRENVGQSTDEQIDQHVVDIIKDRSHNDRKLHRLLTRIYETSSHQSDATRD